MGNSDSSTAICSLWTQKEKVDEELSRDSFSVLGQCYSKSVGISLMLRNLLANKRIRDVVLCGIDLNHTADALVALSENGVDEKNRIVGVDGGQIDANIPKSSIDVLRDNVTFHDRRDITSGFGSLESFIDGMDSDGSYGSPEVFPESEPELPSVLPSEHSAFVIRGRYVCDAWPKILANILRFGYAKPTQYGGTQKEILNLTSVITEENPTNIMWAPYFRFTKEHFDDYVPKVVTPMRFDNLSYTYGQRLRDHNGIDQVASMIDQLKDARHSRRAVAVTWNVQEDHNNAHSPCLDLIQALVQEKLYLTAYFRSNDMFNAWPENALALRKLQFDIAEEVGVKPASLVVISNSAHIYDYNWDEANDVVRHHHSFKPVTDPRGNVIIETIDGLIVLTHLSPEGEPLEKIHGKNPDEVFRQLDELGWISVPYHFMDIGSEVQKAYLSILNGVPFTQDLPLSL